VENSNKQRIAVQRQHEQTRQTSDPEDEYDLIPTKGQDVDDLINKLEELEASTKKDITSFEELVQDSDLGR
jgi:hypothetical protein